MTTDDTTAQNWLRLEVLSHRPDHDASILGEIGALGAEVQDADTYVEGVEFPPVPEGTTRLIAYFEGDRDPDVLEERIREALPDAEVVSLTGYDDRSWETAWMRHFEALRLSPRIAVGPPWDEPERPEKGVAVVIEPGMAFGTGGHATTRLSAQLLDETIGENGADSILDVGCGSAILSMAASGLGVDRVMGIDVDDRAVEVARTNIEENGFSPDEIELSTRPLDDIDETFDIVVANILAPILLELRPALQSAVTDGGNLLLSGIPEDRFGEVEEAFRHPDFELIRTGGGDDWRALQFCHRPRDDR